MGGQQVGGLLNTGTIVAQAVTKENTTSSVSANALPSANYATVPRIVVSGEALTSGSSTTPGVIQAVVTGPGGGGATAIAIAPLANVPEIDVLLRGTISATVQSTTLFADLRFRQCQVAVRANSRPRSSTSPAR